MDEEGTEAAAATVIRATGAARREPPPVFRADHPFIFLIRDRRTGSILFIGRVVNPAPQGKVEQTDCSENALAPEPVQTKPRVDQPLTLSRSQIADTMKGIAREVQSCGKGRGGTAIVAVEIAPTGLVLSANVVGPWPVDQIARCIERVVLTAEFPHFDGANVKIKFPLCSIVRQS